MFATFIVTQLYAQYTTISAQARNFSPRVPTHDKHIIFGETEIFAWVLYHQKNRALENFSLYI